MKKKDIDKLRSKMEMIFIEGQADFNTRCEHHGKLCEIYPKKEEDMDKQQDSLEKYQY